MVMKFPHRHSPGCGTSLNSNCRVFIIDDAKANKSSACDTGTKLSVQGWQLGNAPLNILNKADLIWMSLRNNMKPHNATLTDTHVLEGHKAKFKFTWLAALL